MIFLGVVLLGPRVCDSQDHEKTSMLRMSWFLKFYMHEHHWDRESVTRRIMRRQGFCT